MYYVHIERLISDLLSYFLTFAGLSKPILFYTLHLNTLLKHSFCSGNINSYAIKCRYGSGKVNIQPIVERLM